MKGFEQRGDNDQNLALGRLLLPGKFKRLNYFSIMMRIFRENLLCWSRL